MLPASKCRGCDNLITLTAQDVCRTSPTLDLTLVRYHSGVTSVNFPTKIVRKLSLSPNMVTIRAQSASVLGRLIGWMILPRSDIHVD